MTTPFRSVLYLPGSRERVLDKARGLRADALIIDLEDAVAPDEKAAARKLVATTLAEGGFGARKILIRVNGADTKWGAEDVAMALAAKPDGILLPKVETPEMIKAVADQITGDTQVWAMMETPLGVLNAAVIAAEIASAPQKGGFVLGTNDLAKDLRAHSRAGMITQVAHVLTAARAFGLVCVDGVFNAFKDENGLRAECNEGRDMGMDGKTLIHPAQLDIANEVFAPDAAAIELAHRQVVAYDEAIARGEAVAVVDGKIVENLHVETAKRLIALDSAIQALKN